MSTLSGLLFASGGTVDAQGNYIPGRDLAGLQAEMQRRGATDTVVIAGQPVPKTWLYIAVAAVLLYLWKRNKK